MSWIFLYLTFACRTDPASQARTRTHDFDGDGFWHANYEAIVLANGLTPMPIPEGKGGDCYDWGAEPVDGFDPSVINVTYVITCSIICHSECPYKSPC